MNFKRELFAKPQQDLLTLTEVILNPLIALETMIQIECVPLPDVQAHVNVDF